MPSASLSLQKAVVGKLKSDTAVSTLVGTSVFDTPNTNAFPRITLGEDQVLTERADCYVGDEVILTIHAWSREVGFPQVKRIGAAVRSALHDADLPLDDFRLVDIAIEDERYMRDPDGITSHAVLTFRALTEPTD